MSCASIYPIFFATQINWFDWEKEGFKRWSMHSFKIEHATYSQRNLLIFPLSEWIYLPSFLTTFLVVDFLIIGIFVFFFISMIFFLVFFIFFSIPTLKFFHNCFLIFFQYNFEMLLVGCKFIRSSRKQTEIPQILQPKIFFNKKGNINIVCKSIFEHETNFR